MLFSGFSSPLKLQRQYSIISYHIVVLKRQNRLKVGTEKRKLKVEIDAVSDCIGLEIRGSLKPTRKSGKPANVILFTVVGLCVSDVLCHRSPLRIQHCRCCWACCYALLCGMRDTLMQLHLRPLYGQHLPPALIKSFMRTATAIIC